MNLLEETRSAIKDSGHKIGDIVFIGSGSSGHACSWSQFKELSNNEYDDGFGAQEVATDLIIAFSDGHQMWRHEYDGSENWDYSKPFNMPKDKHHIRRLFANRVGWESLSEIEAEL